MTTDSTDKATALRDLLSRFGCTDFNRPVPRRTLSKLAQLRAPWLLPRYMQAYLAMAEHAHYRPAAPGDGVGNICLEREQLLDRSRLVIEALTYAVDFAAEEDDGRFNVGCSDYRTNCALVFAIEAARQLNSGSFGGDTARQLLNMALEELDAVDRLASDEPAV